MGGKKTSELNVITKAKDLSKQIFEICEKSPKKFRLSLVTRMQNLSLDIISKLHEANDTFVDINLIKDINRTLIALDKKSAFSSEMQEYHEKMKQLLLRLTKAIKMEERISRRLDCSFRALTLLKELDHVIIVSSEMACITSRQQEQLAEKLFVLQNMIGAYIKSDKTRYNY